MEPLPALPQRLAAPALRLSLAALLVWFLLKDLLLFAVSVAS